MTAKIASYSGIRLWNDQLMAWHYTTADHLAAIRASGCIQATPIGNGSLPVTWFSLNQRVDLSAVKVSATGPMRAESLTELCKGLVRIGLPAKGLSNVQALRRKARIAPLAWYEFKRAALIAGANPHEWFGCIGSVDFSLCQVQRWSESANDWVWA